MCSFAECDQDNTVENGAAAFGDDDDDDGGALNYIIHHCANKLYLYR